MKFINNFEFYINNIFLDILIYVFLSNNIFYCSECNIKNIKREDLRNSENSIKELSLINFNIFKIESKYKIESGNSHNIKILGEYFVKKNNSLCWIEYLDNKYNLAANITDIDKNYYRYFKEEFKLIITGRTFDFSFMFYGCENLVSVKNLLDDKTIVITNLSSMFYNCKSLTFLSNMPKFDTNNVTDMSYVFYNCSSLMSLPDISKWDTNNVTTMSNIFYNCRGLRYLPDISKWNTEKVKLMDDVFYNCSSLMLLPDISKWDTLNVINMFGMFYCCSSLISLPDISKWNTKNVANIDEIFLGCSSLVSLPDISKWDTTNVKSMFAIFCGCSSLVSLPNISNFFKKEISYDYIFSACISLVSLPDLFLMRCFDSTCVCTVTSGSFSIINNLNYNEKDCKTFDMCLVV